VLTGDGNIVEAQVTAEGETYDEEGLLRLLRLARIGCGEIFAAQDRATGGEEARSRQAGHRQPQSRQGPRDRDLLGPYGIEPVSAAELDLPEPDEIGTTFIDNADLKARQAADLSGLPASPTTAACASKRSATARASIRRAGRCARSMSPPTPSRRNPGRPRLRLRHAARP
jgi:hypothetical protein